MKRKPRGLIEQLIQLRSFARKKYEFWKREAEKERIGDEAPRLAHEYLAQVQAYSQAISAARSWKSKELKT